MEKIMKFFEEYSNFEVDSSKARWIREMIVENLAEMLPQKECKEIEASFNLYTSILEQTAFINGFKAAIQTMSNHSDNTEV